jgi:hypothetical protein
MAEIILSPDEGLEQQMRQIHDVAGDERSWDLHWHPRPDKPHGGVVVVPDSVAADWSSAQARHRADEEESQDEELPDDEADSDAQPDSILGADEVPVEDGDPADPLPDDAGTEDVPAVAEPVPAKTTTTRRGKAAQAADGSASA